MRFEFARSETIGRGLPIVFRDPVPNGVTGRVKYRRYMSNDDWSYAAMRPGRFELTRRGRVYTLSGLGTALPSLDKRAGKYEYFVEIDDGRSGFTSVTGDRPIFARYKARVPVWAIIAHILVIFSSMMFAVRTVLEALVGGDLRWMIVATLASLILGAFFLGPLVQWYAFGVWWAGIPFGYDWTDNKVLLSLLAWGFALWANRGGRCNRRSVYAAGVVTLLVYFIPHSMFGSEYDYRTGTGQGTTG